MKIAQHALASLFTDIERSDPRIDKLGQNAHEFTFLDFAFNHFRDNAEELTLSNVARWVECFIECIAENVYRECCEDGEECSRAVQDFFKLLDVFKTGWEAADVHEKTGFILIQLAAIAKILAERAEAA